MALSIVILAAGSGKRMRSSKSKMLHQLGGKTLLEHVVGKAHKLISDIYVVYGHDGHHVREQLKHLDVKWVEQKERLGTGHAVLQALTDIDDDHRVLVLVGDSPLISVTTLQQLMDNTPSDGVGLVTTMLEDPTGFGRVLHDQTGKVLSIVEDRDATEKQKNIKQINSGIITAPAKLLKHWLPQLKNNNAQGEFYLTDIIALASSTSLPVTSFLTENNEEVLGINDRVQLANLERQFQQQQAQEIMLSGVTLSDPNRFDLRGELHVGIDITIDINVVLEGRIMIGDNCNIGPQCYLRNVKIGKNVTLLANCVIEDAVIEDNSVLGPFVRIRPGTHVQQNVKLGNFVEIKNSNIGQGSKVSHLSYIGDTDLGQQVTVGAGAITVNYDGANKYRTTVGDGAFIGCDSQLIAPVTIGENAFIGAGSTISKNAPANELTLNHKEQITRKGWKRPEKINPSKEFK